MNGLIQLEPGNHSGRAWFAVLLCLSLPQSVFAQLTANERAALADLGPSYAARFELKRGWFRGQPIQYFDIGPQEATSGSVFIFVSSVDAEGQARPIPGADPVFSSIPGLPGYSAIWRINYVVVRSGRMETQPRDGRAALGLTLSGAARLVIPGGFINYSIVPDGSTLDGDPDSRPLRGGWYKGQRVSFFDFGATRLEPAPIFPFVTGFDGDAPRFLRAQANIVDAVPGSDEGTHDLWDVQFVLAPEGYEPDAIRDLATLRARRFPIRRAGQVRNCPVVIIDGRRAPR